MLPFTIERSHIPAVGYHLVPLNIYGKMLINYFPQVSSALSIYIVVFIHNLIFIHQF